MNIGSKRPSDVLIIGGGSAGLRAAIEAHEAGANVLIISNKVTTMFVIKVTNQQ